MASDGVLLGLDKDVWDQGVLKTSSAPNPLLTALTSAPTIFPTTKAVTRTKATIIASLTGDAKLSHHFCIPASHACHPNMSPHLPIKNRIS
jgi:hypothetical protein